MKKRSGWIKFQIVQAMMMAFVALFLIVRTRDGHGTYQTVDFKMISLGIWMLFCVGLLAAEWLIHWIVRRAS